MAQSRVSLLTDCTPETLLTIQPCLNCLSVSQLLQLNYLLWLYRVDGNLDDVINDLDGASCLNCMSDKQLLIAQTAIIMEWLDIDTDEYEAFKLAMACTDCADPKLIRAATIQKLCEYVRTVLFPT